MPNEFHWKDGWYFWREEDGSVSFEHRTDVGESVTTIDASSWASIVAHASARGETSETYHAALEFHNQAQE